MVAIARVARWPGFHGLCEWLPLRRIVGNVTRELVL